VGEEDCPQIFAIVARRIELLGRGAGLLVADACPEEERHGPDLSIDVVSESGVDEKVAFGVLHQQRGHREVASVKKRAAPIAKGGAPVRNSGGELNQ
jgi:hypothetical protein